MTDYQTDESLVRSFQAGDKESFDRLVIKYKDKIFHLCYRFFGDYDEANDSAQDVFVKVYVSLKGFRGESAFSTWLYRITVNTCKNKLGSLRYRFKSKVLSLDDEKDGFEYGEVVNEIPDESGSPLCQFEKKQREMQIQRAINSLPLQQKTVVVLRHVEGLSYEEIAGVTGYNPGTVKSKLARARDSLKERLKGVI